MVLFRLRFFDDLKSTFITEWTLCKGKPFQILLQFYSDIQNGTSNVDIVMKMHARMTLMNCGPSMLEVANHNLLSSETKRSFVVYLC